MPIHLYFEIKMIIAIVSSHLSSYNLLTWYLRMIVLFQCTRWTRWKVALKINHTILIFFTNIRFYLWASFMSMKWIQSNLSKGFILKEIKFPIQIAIGFHLVLCTAKFHYILCVVIFFHGFLFTFVNYNYRCKYL